MIQQRTTASKKIVKACRKVYEKYESNATVKCLCSKSLRKTQCDHFVFAELYMGFKAAGLLARDWSDKIPSNASVSMTVTDLTKLFNDISTILTETTFEGDNYRHNCCTSITNEITTIKDALLQIDPLELDSFSQNQVEKTVVTWETMVTWETVEQGI